MTQLQLTSASQASDSTMDMAGKALPRDGIEQSRNLHTPGSYNPNVVKPSLEARPSKTRHRYYPFIEVTYVLIHLSFTDMNNIIPTRQQLDHDRPLIFIHS